MPVESFSSWHAENAPIWERCRAAVRGSDAVKGAGEAFLPKPSGMDEAEYDAYVQRALYFNAAQRTHDGLVGMVMGRPAFEEIPAGLSEAIDYIDGRGSRLEDFARFAVSETLEVGGGLCVVDHPERPEGIVTAAQERAAGLRPRAMWYPLESVMEYRLGIIAGNEELVFLKLWEHYEQLEDEWTVKSKPQVRVYDMFEGRVRVRLFRQAESGFWTLYSEAYPAGRSGQGLTYIPAVFFGPISNEPGKPPLLDLIDINLAHYRNSADLEHALHFTGLPTAYASGVRPEEVDEGLKLGSSVGYAFEDAQAKIQFASFGADGLGALKQAMDDKVQQMAALGARMLVPEAAQPESGQALAIRRAGENSALAKLADSVSRSVVLVLETMAEWMGVTGEISYSLNTDFLPGNLTGNELTALVASWQAGALTSPELFEQLKHGGIIRDDKTYEEHEAEADMLDESLGAAPAGATVQRTREQVNV